MANKYLEDYASTGKKAKQRFIQGKDWEIPVIAEEFYEEPDRVNVRVKHDEDRRLINIPIMLPSAGDGYGEVPPIEFPQPGMLTVPDVPMEGLREDSDYTDVLDKHRDHVAEDGYFSPGLRFDDQEAVESAPGDYDRQYPGGYRERNSETGEKVEAHPSGHTVQTDEGGTLISSPGDEQLCYVSQEGMFMASAANSEHGGDEAGSDSAWDDNPIQDGKINWDAYSTAEVTESGCTFSTPVGEEGERSEQTITPEGIASAFPIENPEDPEEWENCLVGMGEDGIRLRFPTEEGFQEGFEYDEDDLSGFCEIAVDSEKIRCQTDEADLTLEDDQFRCTNASGSELVAEGEDVAAVSPEGASVGASGGEMFGKDPEGNSIGCDGNSVTAESAAGHSLSVDQEGISGKTADGTEFGISDGEITAETSQGGELGIDDNVAIPELETQAITNVRYREDGIETTVSGTYQLDPEEANIYYLKLEGNTTLEFANVDDELGESLWVLVEQGAVGGYDLEWPAETLWNEGEGHEMSSDSNAIDAISFAHSFGMWVGIPSAYNIQEAT